MNDKLGGVIPALVTPLNADETLNERALAALVSHLMQQGADGFYVGGATGEGLLLDSAVRERLCEAALAAAGGKAPVIIHIADMRFATAVRLARHAEAAGAAAIAAIPPLYFAYGEDDIYEYYKRLARSVNIPLMIYYAQAANRPMSMDLFSRIFEIDNVTAVKWTNQNYFGMLSLRDCARKDISVFNGADETLLCGLAAGADGGIGTTYNFMLPLIRRIYDCFHNNDMAAALSAQSAADKIIARLLRYPVIPSTKAILEDMGFAVGRAMFPQAAPGAETRRKLLEELRDAGLERAVVL